MPEFEVNGIDVSRWQGVIDWDKALNREISFTLIKASEGLRTIDSQFKRNMYETGVRGIPRGIYHYFRPDLDWKKQAAHFAALINAHAFELEPVIDLENHGKLSRYRLNNVCASFTRQVEDLTGKEIMIYTSAGFFNARLPQTDWAWRKPLWLAHWIKSYFPRLPVEWSSHQKTWLFWQHSSRNGLGQHYGVSTKNIDLNRFNGSKAQFIERYRLPGLPELPPSPPAVEHPSAPNY